MKTHPHTNSVIYNIITTGPGILALNVRNPYMLGSINIKILLHITYMPLSSKESVHLKAIRKHNHGHQLDIPSDSTA